MTSNLKKIILTSFVVICSIFFINIDDVEAETQSCGGAWADSKFTNGISCDYNFFGGTATIYFAKTEENNYCPEIQHMEYYAMFQIPEGINDVTCKIFGIIGLNCLQASTPDDVARGFTTFDLNDSTVTNALDNNQCPQLKMVHEYNAWTKETTKITVSDKDMNKNFCDLSQIVSFGSECSISDGTNMQILGMQDDGNVDSDKVDSTVKEQIENNQESENRANGISNVEGIIDWGTNVETNGGEYSLDEVGDACGFIDPALRDLLNTLFWIISVAGIVLLIIMTAISFVKAITGSDDEKLRDAFKHLIIRAVVVVVLLLLPVILTAIIDIINRNAGGEVIIGADGNPTCSIGTNS